MIIGLETNPLPTTHTNTIWLTITTDAQNVSTTDVRDKLTFGCAQQ